jgi:hypothetical protein
MQITDSIMRMVNGLSVQLKVVVGRSDDGKRLDFEGSVESQHRTKNFPAPANFLPDPFTEPMLARVGGAADATPALFLVTTLSDRGLAGMYVTVDPAADGDSDSARGVVSITDMRPQPHRYFFDARGQLQRIEYGPLDRLRRMSSRERREDPMPALLRSLLERSGDPRS